MGWGNSFDKAADEAISKASGVPEEWKLLKCQDDPKGNIDFGLMPLLPSKPQNNIRSSSAVIFEEMTKQEFEEKYCSIDLGAVDSQTVLTTFEDGKIKQRIIPTEEIYNNLKPTHDPYTNPDAHIYYECSCGAILDPQTKSFAALNNYASKMGWKIRFGENGYTPYCVKCGEGVE